MDKYELNESFMDLSQDQLIENFHKAKICPTRILAYFKVYEVYDIKSISPYEFKISKERLLADLDYNLKQDIVDILSY